ncbi:hypothetical protein Meth11DRAFT_2011 [Methylophilaceae bacterium 11]|jgi:flagellar biosynthesis protein FliR|uniref:hypothetical protein n=1 Tax=Methylotenera sp. 1P/1 TaxID=1131551 RepID=UPI00037CD000|nr:hypothetical protein [Methylotenera sp. 1P/1]EUJ11171.1 hypothetical protein Meth11DRAFT_2011 [Methylophilaceae bacterium 11]
MYESRHHPPISQQKFLLRMALHTITAALLLLFSLAIGMLGYLYFEHLSWHSAFLNAAMLLGGMGPVDPPQTDHGKLFAGLYALYAGLVFLVIVGLFLAPVAHRIMHKFHWTQDV